MKADIESNVTVTMTENEAMLLDCLLDQLDNDQIANLFKNDFTDDWEMYEDVVKSLSEALQQVL